jgi:N-methylhydantoinase A/oxoprolinase/acetone carboxylase beta subunit
MTILLGIDTGGTYTDAVLFDKEQGVLASAKALTTKHDLSLGVRDAIESVLGNHHPEISLASLSTTLATNAIVEGQGSPICLLLLGYPPDSLEISGLGKALGEDPVVFVDGGHTISGIEQRPLDLEAVSQAILMHAGKVAAFAVSGYFGVLNPSHELVVRDLVRETVGLPVTCGHELTSNLHAPRRALTAALNARLIPFLQQLILAVEHILSELNIQAPLMVVKGDGSLMSAQVAQERPVETILSGPAASVVGARFLSGEQDVLVVDMGGTTTDIAFLQDGRPALSLEGATVGGWQTMVEAVAVHTTGLGGDSEVRFDEKDGLVLGPQRVVPLSLLAHLHPDILEDLRDQAKWEKATANTGRFALLQRPMDTDRNHLDEYQSELRKILSDGPLSLDQVYATRRRNFRLAHALVSLVERGLVVMSGFTPSDASHILGFQENWSLEAARLGERIWSRRAMKFFGESVSAPGAFSQRVFQQVVVQLGRAALSAALSPNRGLSLSERSHWRSFFVDRALDVTRQPESLVDVALTLRPPLVAVGAPAQTYFPELAGRLHTRLSIPRHAEIANAVGAVVGVVAQTVRALIRQTPDESAYRVHMPTGIQDFPDLEAAAEYATGEAGRLAEEQALRAGARDVHLTVERQDHIFHPEIGEPIYFDTEVTAVAVGRPRLAEEIES